MKDLGAEPVVEPAAHSDLARATPADAAPTAELTPAAAPAADRVGAPSVLDHLRRGRLAEGWAAVTDDPGHDLPGRADLERRFGTSLSTVRVHSGPAARSLLDHLGARAAANGQHIAVRDRSVSNETLVHEVVHTIQSPTEAAPTSVVDHHDPAEDEAEAIALGLRPAQVHRTIRPGRVALRRPHQHRPDPASGPIALGSESLDTVVRAKPRVPAAIVRPPRRKAPNAEATPSAVEEVRPTEPAPAPERAAEPAGQPEGEATGAEGAAGEMMQGGEAAQDARTPADAAAEPAAPNRRDELAATLDESQSEFDDGAAAAEDHEVEACPEHANQPGTQPFARGPPLDVPAVSTEPAPDPTDPAAVPTKSIERARTNVNGELARAPARSPPVNTAGLDDEAKAAKRETQAKVRGALNRAVGEAGVKTIADEKLDLSGKADPERITTKQTAVTATITAHRGRGRDSTTEDFGESVMAPASDPTTNLDTGLDGLAVPAVSVESMVDTAKLDAVATDANVGAVPIDGLVLATDEATAESRRRVEAISTARGQIDTEIAASDVEAERHCTRARATKTEVAGRVRQGIEQRRGAWSTAVDRHVDTRSTEADGLVRTRRAHITKVQKQADTDAGAVITGARTEGTTLWNNGQKRAENKANESNDSSWFSRGLKWIEGAIRDLTNWFNSFIADLRSAIDGLLDAAAKVAHAIIDAGHQAITATIDGLHTALDVIADNLPGELGELANEYRGDIHDWLDDRQAEVDQWAEDLHAGVDETIENARETFHAALDVVQEKVNDVAETVLDILENGFMPWLRQAYPSLAALIDEGLLGPIQRASDLLGDWLSSALEATGIAALQAEMEALHVEALCEPRTEQEQAEGCAAFEAQLQGALDTVDQIMASPLAQRLQAFLQESQDDAASQQVDAATGFFDFIGSIARPVYEWWQSVEPTVEAALADLGQIASTIWTHVANALGIDPNLSPLEAIRQGLESLWETVSAAVAPLVEAIRSAWNWLRNSSFLAPVFDFFASLGELATALSGLMSRMVDGTAAWLAEAAQVLSTTVLPAVEQVTGALADLVLAAVACVEGWIDGIIGALDMVIAFEIADPLLDALAGIAAAVATPVKMALEAFKSCALRAWRWLANSLRNIVTFVRTLLDVATGLSVAILAFPIGLVAFFAGNVWLHLLPECYKAPIINFFLDLAIRFVQFMPEPADFMWGIIYQGVLNFLIGIRTALDELKVGAINLFASIAAGNAEVAAGFAVGLAEGVWEATGGTIIFLLQAIAWIMALPFKLAGWAIGMIRGTLEPDAEGGEEAGGEMAGAEGGEAETGGPGVRHRAPRRAIQGGGLPRDGPTVAESPTTQAAPDAAPELAAERAADEAAEIAAERAADEAADRDEQRLAEADDGGGGEAAAAAAADQRQLDMLEQPGVQPIAAGGGGAIQEEAEAGSVDDPLPEVDGGEADGAVSSGEVHGDEAATDEAIGGDVDDATQRAGVDESGATPPAGPEGIGTLSGAFDRWISEGFSREDVQQLMDGAREALRGMIATLAQQAAGSLLTALNAQGAGFAIGRAMGAIVGMILVEVLLAAFTGGASAAVSATKAAISGARITAKFASVIAKVKRAIEPLLGIVQRLRGALGDVLRGVSKWFDDVLGWMRGLTRRVKGPRRPPRRPPTRPRRPGARPPRSHRPHRRRPEGRRPDRRRPNRRRDRRRDQRRDDERRRRRARARLRRAQALLPARMKRVAGARGVPRGIMQARLRGWRRQFRLTRLWSADLGPRTQFTARANPTGNIAGFTDCEARELAQYLRTESDRILSLSGVEDSASTILQQGSRRRPTASEAAELKNQRWAGRGAKNKPKKGGYNIPGGTERHGIRSYDIPAGTNEATLASMFRRMPARSPTRGANVEPTDLESLATVLNFGPRNRTYLRQRPPGTQAHLENVVLAVLPRKKGGKGAKSLRYAARGNSPAAAAQALRGLARGANAEQQLALAAIMFGQEPTRSTAAFGHALFASDIDAHRKLNPKQRGLPSLQRLLGKAGRGSYSPPGMAPFTGTGAIDQMRNLDEHLAGATLSKSRTKSAKAQLRREMQMIRAWLRTLPDYLVIDRMSKEKRMAEIKSRITLRLERSARSE